MSASTSNDVISEGESSSSFLGKTFSSFSDVQKFMQFLELNTKQKFTTRDSRTIKTALASTRVKRYLKEDLVYYSITYACIHGGGKFKSKSKGIRKTSTYKMGCPFKVKFLATTCGNYLKIVEFSFKHEGHELSEKVYEHLPHVRKLNNDEAEEVEKYLEVLGNTKIVQNKIMLEKHKKVTLKDLNNMKWKLKQDSNDLQNAIKLLKEDYKADVAILQDDDGNFKALYFSTERMRSSVSAFPEIIFLDGTYKLLNNGLMLMLFVVEDSNGLTEVGGVVLIVHEDYETFKWFLTKFRENNELASSKIKCFMTDKDLLERNVIKEIFVGIPVYTCLFHTLKIFRRTVTTDKYDISKKERETCLELLTKLAYSSSEEAYEQAYNVFVDTCPPTIVDYFNKNWHYIRSEWTCYSMIHGTLKNRTNNRLESLNQKIKDVVPLNSSLCLFLKHFLNWLRSHNEERSSKVAKIILKRPVTNLEENSSEKKYMDFLTPYAYSYVLRQCELSKKVTITEDAGVFKAKVKGNNIVVNVTTCECSDFLSMILPCRHILSLRNYLNFPLFCEDACDKRWRRGYYLKMHNITSANSPTDNIPVSCTITSVQTPKILNPSEKRKRANLVTNSLVNLACLSSNSQFQYKMDCLKKIEMLWRQGYEVNIEKIDINENSTLEAVDHDFDLENVEDETLVNSESVDNIGCTAKSNTEGVQYVHNDWSGSGFLLDHPYSEIQVRTPFREIMDNSLYTANEHEEVMNQVQKVNSTIAIDVRQEAMVNQVQNNSNRVDMLHSSSDENEHAKLIQNQVENNVNTACSRNEDHDLSGIIMPQKIKRKGRPKGADQTVIGLKKRRKINIPMRFVLKPLETQKLQVLGEIVSNEDAIKQCIAGEYQIKITDIKSPNCLSHCLFDPQINLSLIQDLLDSTAFQHISQYIEITKSNYEWCCTICSSPLGELKSICCDSCMKWYHFKCVGLAQVPVRRTWFCRKCF